MFILNTHYFVTLVQCDAMVTYIYFRVSEQILATPWREQVMFA